MWLAGALLAGIASLGVASSGVASGVLARHRPTLSLDQFAARWPGLPDPIEKPRHREKLRRLIAYTADADPDKARFWMALADDECARWRSQSDRARALSSQIFSAPAGDRAALATEARRFERLAAGSWADSVAAYTAAAVDPRFGRRDTALFELVRLELAAAAGGEQ
jgi:hypothetical protein